MIKAHSRLFLILWKYKNEESSHGTKAKKRFHTINKKTFFCVKVIRAIVSARENNDKYISTNVDLRLKRFFKYKRTMFPLAYYTPYAEKGTAAIA